MDQRGSDLHGRIDKEKLITEVRRRSLLWQDHRGDLKNKDFTDKLWEEIAEVCSVSPTDAKKKWKNLKDHFRKEYKKFAFSGPPIDFSTRPRWQYFDSMLFIKDYMTPYRSSPPRSGQEQSDNNESVDLDYKFPVYNGEDIDSKSNLVSFNLPGPSLATATPPLPPPPPPTPTNEQSRPQPQSHSDLKDDTGIVEPLKKKRKAHGDLKLALLELEKRKMELLEKEFKRESIESPELQFFRSILPHMENLSQTEKLEVRAAILQVIINKQNEKRQRQLNGE